MIYTELFDSLTSPSTLTCLFLQLLEFDWCKKVQFQARPHLHRIECKNEKRKNSEKANNELLFRSFYDTIAINDWLTESK